METNITLLIEQSVNTLDSLNRGLRLTTEEQSFFCEHFECQEIKRDGDSGAIVYSYVSSTGYRYTLGIHQGASTDGKTAHFCKADLINQKLGIFRY